jgi:hypothetical protein
VPSEPTGWWVDEDIATIDLSAAVRAGENELVLAFDYSSDMELEDLHLIGSFGVRQHGPGRRAGNFTLVAPPAELAAGSWVGQGLDFYGAAVRYRLTVPASVWNDIGAGRRIRLALPEVRGTCSAVHVGDRTLVLPWPPLAADITEALLTHGGERCDEVVVEVVGGRHNILGPLHVPWLPWTGPGEFDPHHQQWTDEYLLNDHGLMAAPVFEILR